MKKYTLLCLFVIGITALLRAQSLSFNDALSQMRSGNQKLKGIEKQTEAADYNRKSFRGLYLPQLSLNASYMHLADPLSLDFNEYKAPLQSGLQGFATQVPAPMRPLITPYLAEYNRFLPKTGTMSFRNKTFGK